MGRSAGRPASSERASCSLSLPRRPQLAGALLLERAQRGAERDVASKSTPTDLVSEADLAAQRAIRELLARPPPARTASSGEEGGDEAGSSGLRWIVDPLDGTVNYLFGIPQWSVSVAVADAEGTLAGAVYDPNRGELFTATRARERPCSPATSGAARPRAPIRANAGEGLATAMVATGLAYDAGVRERAGARARAGSPGRSATSAASAAPRSTSRGRRRDASTPTSSARSSRGTSRPAS